MATRQTTRKAPGSHRIEGGDAQDQAFIALFRDRATRDPDRVALRHKDYGVWRPVTWGAYREQVETFALGLGELGLQAGDRVAVMGDPVPEWLYTDLAVQSVGAITYGIYVTTSADGMRYLLVDGGAKFLVAEDQEYVDKLLEAEEEHGPLVEHIVVADTQGMFFYEDSRLRSFADVQELGRARREREPGAWGALVDRRSSDEVIRIFYTSGTTGAPKGGLLSSRNLVATWQAVFDTMDRKPGPDDRTVTYLPLAHVGETIMSLVLPVLYGTVPHVPEDEEGVTEALVEVSPTILLAFPRVWETYASQALVDIETGSRLKRKAYQVALGRRRALLERIWRDERPSPWTRASAWLAYQLVFRHLLNKFGYRDARFVITGGAPVSPDVVRLWQIWGVQIMEIYGMTECGGIATIQTDRVPRPGLAGRPVPGVEIRLADDGEILIRGSGIFKGYWKREEATAEAVDADGWLHTGDIGEFLPDGNLRMIDRKKDILITAQGQVVPASEMEHGLKFGPYIRDAMLVGDGRPYLGALIEIDFENVAEWARKEKIVYTSFTNLATNPRVQQLLQGAVDEANSRLRAAGRPEVQSFQVLPKELDPELDDEITPTRKVKRRQLERKFADLVDAMYRTEESERIARQMGQDSQVGA